MSARYDDGHRGPAVDDALQLSECWLQLVSADIHWPGPANVNEASLEVFISATYPEEQRESALAGLDPCELRGMPMYGLQANADLSAVVTAAEAAQVGAEAAQVAVYGDLASTVSGKGGVMIGFRQSHTNAAPRTMLAKASEVVSIKDWGATGDGATDDASAIAQMIGDLSDGARVLVPAGTYVIGAKVTFTQNDLLLVCEPGAQFKQETGTLTMDTMMEFSGVRVTIHGGKWNGNLAGNAGTYTGRGELVRLSGDYPTTKDMVIDGVKEADFACGIYIACNYASLFNISTYNTGRTAIRDGGDYTRIDGLSCFDMYNTSGTQGNKGIAKDNTPSGSAFRRVDYRNLYFHSADAAWFEGVVFDHDGVQGGDAFIDGIFCNFPNLAGSAGDVSKFVYCDSVTLRGFRAIHASALASPVTVRFQEGVAHVVLDDCVFPGCVNFDATVNCEMLVKGGTVFGDTLSVSAGVEDFRGVATFEDGTKFKNLTTNAVYTSNDDSGLASTFIFGRCHYHGASGTPYLARFVPLFTSGTKRRFRAGSVKALEPLSVTGTFKTRETNGVWGTHGEAAEAGFAQGGDRVFLVGSAWPPNEIEGYKLGDIIRKRSPAAGDAVADYRCTTAGAACTTAWASSTAYIAGQWRHNGGNVYAVVTAGTSAGSGGPTGTGAGITDGTVVWDYVDTLAVFKGVGSVRRDATGPPTTGPRR